LEIGQFFHINPVPVQVVFPNDRIGSMGNALRSRAIPVGWAPTAITKANMAFPPSKNSGTQSYLLDRVNKIGATPGGPVHQETSSKYSAVRRIPLDDYHKEVWESRKEQIEDLKSDEAKRKALKAASDLLEVAEKLLTVASLVVPAARLGSITLEIALRYVGALDLVNTVAQAHHGRCGGLS
jgi:hypothetical protein